MRAPTAILAAIEEGAPITRSEVLAHLRATADRRCKGPLVFAEPFAETYFGPIAHGAGAASVAALLERFLAEEASEAVRSTLIGLRVLPRDRGLPPLKFILAVLRARRGCGQDLNPTIAGLRQDGEEHMIVCPRCATSHPVVTMRAVVIPDEEAAS